MILQSKQRTVVGAACVACLAAASGLFLHVTLTTPKQKLRDGVLIDFDPALGVPFRDVDDAIALHLISKSNLGPKLQTLTTTFGNSAIGATTSNARALGRRYNLPVFKGLRPIVKGMNQTAPAVEALTSHRGSVLALGSMRNIARALREGAIWQQLVVMGGSLPAGPNIPYFSSKELNFAADELSAATVLKLAPASVTTMPVLVTMDVCRRAEILFTSEEIRRLPSWLAWRSTPWLLSVQWFAWKKGFVPWDVIAAMVLVRPDLFKMERLGVKLSDQPGPFTSGYVSFQDKGYWNVVVDFDANAVRSEFRNIISSKTSNRLALS